MFCLIEIDKKINFFFEYCHKIFKQQYYQILVIQVFDKLRKKNLKKNYFIYYNILVKTIILKLVTKLSLIV
jgi:hypothetical protein